MVTRFWVSRAVTAVSAVTPVTAQSLRNCLEMALQRPRGPLPGVPVQALALGIPVQTFKVTSPLPGASAAVAPVSAGRFGRWSPQREDGWPGEPREAFPDV